MYTIWSQHTLMLLPLHSCTVRLRFMFIRASLDDTRLAVKCTVFESAVQFKHRAYLSFTADLLSKAKEVPMDFPDAGYKY